MIKEIEKLNRDIEKIMTEKTKADAQKEVWESRLTESIKAYGDNYGVDLSGKGLLEIKKKIISETGIVEAKVKKEYERSSKIVSLINEGDIKGAWKVLGVNIDGEEEKINEQISTPEIQEVLDEVDEADFFGKVIDSPNDESPSPVGQKVEVQEKPEEKGKVKSFTPVMFEDDGDDDEFITPNISSNSPTDEGVLVMEDDDEDFGGFGTILEGSKFKV